MWLFLKNVFTNAKKQKNSTLKRLVNVALFIYNGRKWIEVGQNGTPVVSGVSVYIPK